MEQVRTNGAFYTVGNPFDNPAFRLWLTVSEAPKHVLLEPFAGGASLVKMLRKMGVCDKSISYDIDPQDIEVVEQDTLKDFPTGHRVCVTNPPWLARNSATMRGLPFPDTDFDDLYKFALKKCLDNCPYVASLVPESFIRADLFQDRLTDFVSLTGKMFDTTNHPVGLALFSPEKDDLVRIWHNDYFVGELEDLKKHLPSSKKYIHMKFNDPLGNLGLVAVDNTHIPSIRFCPAWKLEGYEVKESSRAMTKIHVDGEFDIDELNEFLDNFRKKTYDVFLTCFKGVRKDGMYRRRLDWTMARRIINHLGEQYE